MHRRNLFLLATLALSSSWTLAQSYPGNPIRMVVRLPAGGATDLLARSIALRPCRVGAEVATANTPVQFAAPVQADSERWAAIIRECKSPLD